MLPPQSINRWRWNYAIMNSSLICVSHCSVNCECTVGLAVTWLVVWVRILCARLGRLVALYLYGVNYIWTKYLSALCKSVKKTGKLPIHQQALPLISVGNMARIDIMYYLNITWVLFFGCFTFWVFVLTAATWFLPRAAYTP